MKLFTGKSVLVGKKYRSAQVMSNGFTCNVHSAIARKELEQLGVKPHGFNSFPTTTRNVGVLIGKKHIQSVCLKNLHELKPEPTGKLGDHFPITYHTGR